MATSEPTTGSPTPRGPFAWLGRRGRGGSAVLVGTLFAGVLVASIGAGYSATKADLDDPKASVAKGNDVLEINAETERVEAEARALAKGREGLEVVTLKDGRIATVNHKTNEVVIMQYGDPDPERTTPESSSVSSRPEDQVTIVAGNDAGYMVDPVGNTVTMIVRGHFGPEVEVPKATNEAVADSTAGIWVRTNDDKVVHVVGDHAEPGSTSSVEHLTIADGAPIAITSDGKAIDLAAIRVVANSVPHGPEVIVGSPRGAGRYLLVLEPKSTLTVIDPRTHSVTEYRVPPDTLGAPVQLDSRIYVPDYEKGERHALLVFDLNSEEDGPVTQVHVPGKRSNGRYSLEVRGHRVWANDQFDRRALVIDRKGRGILVDKGKGEGLTDTDRPRAQDDEDSGQRNDPPRRQAPPADPPPADPAPPTESGDDNKPNTLPLVTVPAITEGTPKQEACDQIMAARLRCAAVEIGSGGETGTVQATDPPAGYRLLENAVVTVHVYGRITVPDVVGQRSDQACKIVDRTTGSALPCRKQPFSSSAPSDTKLDEVTEQDPLAGKSANSGTTVTVRFYDRFTMPDLTGQDGQSACQSIVDRSNGLITCQLAPGPPAGDEGQRGTVSSQSIASGVDAHVADSVTLNVYGDLPPAVPDVVNRGKVDACGILETNGYTCNPVPDGQSLQAVVSSQDPPAGTRQTGGTVVVHYSPHNSAPLGLYRSTADPDVFALRFTSSPPNTGYELAQILGWAYDSTATDQLNTAPVNGFMCTKSREACGNRKPNHYYTRDTDTDLPNWVPTSTIARVLNPQAGPCPPGQVLISRLMRTSGNTRLYTVARVGPALPPGWEYIEPLGCIWDNQNPS